MALVNQLCKTDLGLLVAEQGDIDVFDERLTVETVHHVRSKLAWFFKIQITNLLVQLLLTMLLFGLENIQVESSKCLKNR